jgi:hypothetical protein
VTSFRQGDLDCLDGLYAILNAYHLALSPMAELTPDEARGALRLAINNLADRRTAMDTFTYPMAPRRAVGLAKMMGRYLSNQERQLHAEQAPRLYNSNIEQVFAWIKASLVAGMCVVVMLEGETRRYMVISRIDEGRLYFFDGCDLHSIERKDCVVRSGLHRLKTTNMFRVKVVKLQSIFEPFRYIHIHGHKVIPNG